MGDRTPIKGEDGSTDHRGRKWPISGCPCIPCFLAQEFFIIAFQENHEEKKT